MMDTRKEFVKMMCENRDILRLWNARTGDFIWVKEEDYVDCDNEKEGCIYTLFESEGSLCFDGGISYGRSTDYVGEGYFVELSEVPTAVWLPRQDQLQEMALAKEYHEDNIDHLLMRFLNMIHTLPNFDWHYWGRFRTMEQKWLAFLMWVKFEKRWNGKEWVKI